MAKKNHGGHHGGSWKVAYADFVTAMMALFLCLWLTSQDQKIKDAVEHLQTAGEIHLHLRRRDRDHAPSPRGLGKTFQGPVAGRQEFED
jgi:flagellar motor protein MotB